MARKKQFLVEVANPDNLVGPPIRLNVKATTKNKAVKQVQRTLQQRGFKTPEINIKKVTLTRSL